MNLPRSSARPSLCCALSPLCWRLCSEAMRQIHQGFACYSSPKLLHGACNCTVNVKIWCTMQISHSVCMWVCMQLITCSGDSRCISKLFRWGDQFIKSRDPVSNQMTAEDWGRVGSITSHGKGKVLTPTNEELLSRRCSWILQQFVPSQC